MTLDVVSLSRALHASLEVDEFIASEARSHVAFETLGFSASRGDVHRHNLQAQVFVDRKVGRGAASLFPHRSEGILGQILEATTRAHGALGPSWRLPAPAAPAQVRVFESAGHRGPREVLEYARSEFAKAVPTAMHAGQTKIRVEHRTQRTILSNGFDNQYPSADIIIESMVEAVGGIAVPLRIHVRRVAGLSELLETAFERCRERSTLDAQAEPAPQGLVDVVLLHSAYLPVSETDYGIWTPLVEQASAARVRGGMSTHSPGRALLPTPVRGDALSIRSEGTKPFALRCAPFSRDGQATRNFAITDDGDAVGMSIGHRDSALGAGPANGGVRRLVVDGGPTPARELARPTVRPLLYIRALDVLRTTRRGSLHLDVASGELRSRDAVGAVQSKQIRSAILCGRLQDWLGDAHFSRETEDDGWLAGPKVIRFNNLRIH